MANETASSLDIRIFVYVHPMALWKERWQVASLVATVPTGSPSSEHGFNFRSFSLWPKMCDKPLS